MNIITGYRAFCIFKSVQLHFNDSKYDVVDYGFNPIRFAKETYEKQYSKNHFEILAKRTKSGEYLFELLIATFLIERSVYITNITEDFEKYEKYHLNWKDRIQGLSYLFKQQTAEMINNGLKFDNNMAEFVTKAYVNGIICIEVYCIYHQLFNFEKIVDKNNFMYYTLKINILCANYMSIISYDLDKYKKRLKEVIMTIDS